MKIATFNMQNVLYRNKQLNNHSSSKYVSKWHIEMDLLIAKEEKEIRDLHRLKELSFLLGFENINKDSYAELRRIDDEFFVRNCSFFNDGKANYSNSWNGWLPVQSFFLHPISTQNKARVMAEVNADFLLLQEVEDKNSLENLNKRLLPTFNGVPYEDIYVLQGNDGRGQELALMAKNGFQINSVHSFMREKDEEGEFLFEKNLLKYEIITPSLNQIWVISVHFSETGKDKDRSERKRFRQASRVAEIYQQLLEEGKDLVVVLGTFNSVSYCYSLSPLLQKTDLRDITRHFAFNVDFDEGKDASYYRMGAYKMGVNIKQKDYLLLSPELFKRVKRGGLNRKAVFPSKKPQWPVYSTVINPDHAASEHPVIWAEVDV